MPETNDPFAGLSDDEREQYEADPVIKQVRDWGKEQEKAAKAAARKVAEFEQAEATRAEEARKEEVKALFEKAGGKPAWASLYGGDPTEEAVKSWIEANDLALPVPTPAPAAAAPETPPAPTYTPTPIGTPSGPGLVERKDIDQMFAQGRADEAMRLLKAGQVKLNNPEAQAQYDTIPK